MQERMSLAIICRKVSLGFRSVLKGSAVLIQPLPPARSTFRHPHPTSSGSRRWFSSESQRAPAAGRYALFPFDLWASPSSFSADTREPAFPRSPLHTPRPRLSRSASHVLPESSIPSPPAPARISDCPAASTSNRQHSWSRSNIPDLSDAESLTPPKCRHIQIPVLQPAHASAVSAQPRSACVAQGLRRRTRTSRPRNTVFAWAVRTPYRKQ